MEYCWQCGNLLEHGKVDFCTSHCATLYYAAEDADEDEEEQDETPEPPDVEDEGMVDHDDEDRRAYHEERLRRPTG